MDPGSGSNQPGPQQPAQQGHEPPPPAAPCFPLDVAAAVLAQFESLPKTGKPQPHEYTVLAGIALTLPPAPQLPAAAGQPQPAAAVGGVALPGQLTPQQAQHTAQQQPQREQQLPPLVVVALGTGTKCLAASKRDPSGRAVNDCHAEAACRRALLRWLYCEAAEAVRQQRMGQRDGTAVLQVRPRRPPNCVPPSAGSSVEETLPQPLPLALPKVAAAEKGLPAWELAVRPGVQLHMYVSQPPCGDASILEGLGGSSGGLAAGGRGACGCSSPGGTAAAGTALATAQLAGHAGDRPSVGQHAAGSGQSGLAAVPAAGAAAVLGRTGAKPIKRPRLSQAAEQRSSSSAPPDAAALQLLPLAQPEAPPAQQLLQQQHPPAVNHGEQGRRGEAPPAAPGAAPAPGAPAAAASAPSLPPHVPQSHEVESYAEAQAAGVVRRKPGRGEATLSMSCSDKLARWRLLGLQVRARTGRLVGGMHVLAWPVETGVVANDVVLLGCWVSNLGVGG